MRVEGRGDTEIAEIEATKQDMSMDRLYFSFTKTKLKNWLCIEETDEKDSTDS